MRHAMKPFKVSKQQIRLHHTIFKPPLPKQVSSRKRTRYEENQTAGLALPLNNTELEANKDSKLALLTASKQHIIEHAARRVDLFFYLLIAYHKTHIVTARGRTVLQHGIGRNTLNGENITQACHSSFFGALQDDLLQSTHFLQSMNTTVELPAFVNRLDDELENACGCRINGLDILNQVSTNKIDPIDGLALFFK